MPTTFAGTVFDPRFCVGFVAILGPLLVSFLDFFGLAGDLGASSVFDRRPKRNPSFLHTRRLRNPPKGSSEESLKTDPEKDINKLVLGVSFGSLFCLLGNFWHCLGALCCCLSASWSQRLQKGTKREVQERPRAAKELPKEFQERPRGSQESPGEFQNRPKTAPIFRKRGSSARIFNIVFTVSTVLFVWS